MTFPRTYAVRSSCVVAFLAIAAGSVCVWSSAPPALAGNAQAKPHRLDVVLGVKHRQRALNRFARSVSAPTSARYGKYLDPGQVGRRFGANRRVVRRVRGFLRRRGVPSQVDVTRTFVEALMPARKARRLFRGRLPRALRGRVMRGQVLLAQAAPGQSLPRSTGGEATPAEARRGAALGPPHVRTGTPAGCSQGRNATYDWGPDGPVAGPAFTPNQIQDAYGATPLHDSGVRGRGVRVGIFGASGFGKKELVAGARCFGYSPPPAHLLKIGTSKAGPTSSEAALDLQMVAMMAPGIESLDVYSIGSSSFAVGFSAMIDPRNARGGVPPNVISVSQGNCETSMDRADMRLTEHVLAAAGAAGITVAAGSGDNGSFCLDAPNSAFFPGGASRWITSVGGTSMALNAQNRIVNEVPWNDRSFAPKLGFGGGGGFSRYVRRPWFQHGLGHRGKRANPDVALMADPYPGMAIYCHVDAQSNCDETQAGNPFVASFGTSASTPLFAGIVALADQRLLAAGRPPLGFVDPLLYRLGREGGHGAFRDVVRGSNAAVYTTCCQAGPGYDMASGWGSVNAERLAAIALRRGPR